MTSKILCSVTLSSILILLVFGSLGIVESWTAWKSLRRTTRIVDTTSLNTTEVHAFFMNMALLQAQRAGERGEVPIGALVVQHGENEIHTILAQASNLVETTHDASAHAELLALRQAAGKVKNWRLVNTTLYSTLEPCPMCLSAAQAFRVSSIVYGAPDLRLGAVETHIQLLDVEHPFHTIDQVVPGVLRNESATLLKDFFRQRRKMSRSRLHHSATLRSRLGRLLWKKE